MRIDDAALIEQSRRRPDAFAVLYDRYFGDVYRYVAGRVGETFLVAYGKRRSYDPGRLQRVPVEGGADGGHEDRVAARLLAAGSRGRLAAKLGRLAAELGRLPDLLADDDGDPVAAVRQDEGPRLRTGP
ncbi:hypothetical protein [Nonomuraea sp. NPDC005501]|uniref:hypothetical protein n=1 Tax=Nonomuraea sp. NPDC005501 TaxID=3156884 RepID=UPI0033B54722